MRFLGCKGLVSGAIHGNFAGQVVSDLKVRPEGVRIKHRVNGNSIKMYDKQGSVQRIEATIKAPKEFKVYRPKEGGPAADLAWRTMRRGVADLQRRGEFTLNGFRNRDLRRHLFACVPSSPEATRRQSG